MTRSVTVVGAGLAGAMLATHLARAGHDVTVFESRPDLRTTDIGAGRSINLALATRGIAALDELGLMPTVAPLLTPMRGRMVHDLDGSTSLQPYGNRPEEVIHSVSRSDLNAVLLDAAEEAGASVRFEHRCLGGSVDHRQIRVGDAAGNEFDVAFGTIFGADGANSPVRDMVMAESGGEVHIEPLDHGYKELVLPTALDGSPLLDPYALHIWPRGGYMLIALANLDLTFTCTLFVPHAGSPHTLAELDSPAAVRGFFEDRFPDFAELVPDLGDQFTTNPAGRLATIRCRGWHAADRAVILGDAAHAIVPFHGQGMNAAFESCSLLMDALRQSPDDWEHAFASFETNRKPDVDAIADMALDNYIEMRADVADDRYQLRRMLALDLERRFPGSFTPRYSMVMFSTMPYAEAQRRARLQARVLETLTSEVDRLEDVDFELAEELIGELPA